MTHHDTASDKSKLGEISLFPPSMDRQSKFEEKVKRHRRYSALFDPLAPQQDSIKNGRVTRSSMSSIEANLGKKDKLEKIVKDICEPNLNKVEIIKPLKRKSGLYARDEATGDQMSSKFINLEVLNKKLEAELKPARSRRKSDIGNHSPKNSSDAKHGKKAKIRKESKSASALEKNVSSKENVCKTFVSLTNLKRLEKETTLLKPEERSALEKKQRREIKPLKKTSIKSERVVKIEISKTMPVEEPPVDPEILKIYTDKTVKKFNNLETIFESPTGSFVMGKRKLKRYLNFEETNSRLKQARRQAKVKKINPTFKMSYIDSENLKFTNVDDLI